MKKVCESMELEGKLLCRYEENQAMKALDTKVKDLDYLIGLIVDELPAELALTFMKRHHKTEGDIYSANQYLLRPQLKRPAPNQTVDNMFNRKNEKPPQKRQCMKNEDIGKDVCFRCRKPGHWSKECPLIAGQNPEATRDSGKTNEMADEIEVKPARDLLRDVKPPNLKMVDKNRGKDQSSLSMFFK